MGVYENKQRPGTWIAELRIDGARVGRKSARTEREAKDLYADMRSDYNAGIGKGPDQSVGQLIDYWLDHVSAAKVEDTHVWERRMLNNVGPLLRATKLTDPDLPRRVTNELARLATRPERKRTGRGGRVRPLTLSTLKRIKDLLRQVFNEGVANRWLDWNPAQLAHLPPARTAPRRSYSHVALSVDQVDRLKAACVAADTSAGAMVYTAVTLGLRSGEVRGLRWRRVDLKAGRLSVDAAAHASGRLGPTKGGGASDRDWVLPPDLVAVLRHHQTRQKKASLRAQVWQDTGLCFTNEIGGCIDPSNYRRELEALCKAAKVPKVSPTDLRRTFATLMRDSGGRREDVSHAMGHATTRMVDKHYYAPERRPITLLSEEG